MEEKIYLFDTTLRDGQQTTGVNFSVSDKMILSQHLDELGIDYIEGGWPGANPTDNDYFSRKLICLGVFCTSSINCRSPCPSSTCIGETYLRPSFG